MLRSRRLRWRALAILGWALLFITIIIGCPICLAVPTTTITSLIATKNSSSTSSLSSSSASSSIKFNIMPELNKTLNYSCLTGNTSSSNIIYNISNLNYNISNNNKNLPYNLSNQQLQTQLLYNQNLNNNNNNQLNNITTTLAPSIINDDYTNIEYTTIGIKKLNSIYSKRRRKKLIKNNENNSNYLSSSSSNNNSSGSNNNNSNFIKKVFRINAETLKILRTYPNSGNNITNNNKNNNISDENSTELNDISTTISVETPIISTITPLLGTETSTVLQILLSRTDRSIHQTGENIDSVGGVNSKRGGGGGGGGANGKRNRLNSNLDRNERSANLSHISGGSARKIQLYIKNRFIQIMSDGTINGTQDDLSDYTILQRTTVDIGQIKIQGFATCLYLCMDQCGSVYGSKSFTDDCVFNESMEQHHYNTYSSTYNSNTRRTLYLALNRHGEPRKLQIPPTRSLGKLATYTKSLTSAVSDDRVEKLIAHTFGANRVKHGLRQLCDAGKPLIDLTAKVMKKRPKCQPGSSQSLSSNLNFTSPASLATSSPIGLTSEKSRISSNNSNKNINTNSNSHNSNSTSNINTKKKKKKRRCRPDETDNDNCHRGPQSLKKKPQNQHKLKCNNQNSTETSDCQQRQKKNTINNNNNNNNKKGQGHGLKQNAGPKKNRQQNNSKNNGNNQIRNVNRARNSANSRTTIPSTSRHHHRHMHTSTTTTINPITAIQTTHITTTELNNFNNNDHHYQQDDDDLSIENNNDITDDDLDNDDDNETSSLPPLVSGQAQQHQFVGDDTDYDEELDV